MITSEIYVGTIAIVTDREGKDLGYDIEILTYSKNIGHALLYHKKDYFIDINSKVKYSCKPGKLEIGEKFVNLKRPLIPFGEALISLYS